MEKDRMDAEDSAAGRRTGLRSMTRRATAAVSTSGDGLWDVPYPPVIPAKLQLAVFGLPGFVQVVTGVPPIPVRRGEGLIVVARRG
jgi:hypothetical protein